VQCSEVKCYLQGQPGSLASFPAGQQAPPGPGSPAPDDCEYRVAMQRVVCEVLNMSLPTDLTFDLGPVIGEPVRS
jgi:hypothetical protein